MSETFTPETVEIDFSEYFEDDPDEYARDVLNEVATQNDFERVPHTDHYVNRASFFMMRIPGTTQFAIGVEDSVLKYNPEQVDTEEISQAVEYRLEESSGEQGSWEGVKESLGV